MKYWKIGLIFTLAFLIQTSLLNLISIKGYTPNLLLCFVIVVSFLYQDKAYGIVYGTVFGLLYDICFANLIGATSLALICVVAVIYVLREFTNVENIVNIWVGSIISILVYYGFVWLVQKLGGNPIGFVYVLKHLPWISLYSLAIVTVLYFILIPKVSKYRKDRYFK